MDLPYPAGSQTKYVPAFVDAFHGFQLLPFWLQVAVRKIGESVHNAGIKILLHVYLRASYLCRANILRAADIISYNRPKL